MGKFETDVSNMTGQVTKWHFSLAAHPRAKNKKIGGLFLPSCVYNKVGSGCHSFLIFLMNFGSSHVFMSQECRMQTNVTDRLLDERWVEYLSTDGSDLLNFVAAATEDIKYPSSHKLALWKQNLDTRALQPSISRERSIWMTVVLTSVGLHSNHS